jgi:hypothetical protein
VQEAGEQSALIRVRTSDPGDLNQKSAFSEKFIWLTGYHNSLQAGTEIISAGLVRSARAGSTRFAPETIPARALF